MTKHKKKTTKNTKIMRTEKSIYLIIRQVGTKQNQARKIVKGVIKTLETFTKQSQL